MKSADRLYISPNSYIQTNAVANIAADLKLRLGNINRIEAAAEISKEVIKRLKYNGNTQTIPRTTEILKSGDGICYHFSILFALIARHYFKEAILH